MGVAGSRQSKVPAKTFLLPHSSFYEGIRPVVWGTSCGYVAVLNPLPPGQP